MPQPFRLRLRVPTPAPRTSLCDALDKLLDTGVVVAGELTIKVADIELLYVAVELVAGSWENMKRIREPPCLTPTLVEGNRCLPPPLLEGGRRRDSCGRITEET